MNYGFLIDNRKCIGCHACSVACKAENLVPVGSNRTWVKYVEKGEFPDTRRLFTVTRCNHCANPPCVYICPVTALHQRPDGIVDLDQDRCIGCKACLQACPYDALYIHPDRGTAQKCHYCAHRVEARLEPPCVVVCPEHAIISGDLDDPTTEIARLLAREATTVRKPEQGTRPKLFYLDGDTAALSPLVAPPQAEYMWTSSPAAHGHHGFLTNPRPAATAAEAPRWAGPIRAGDGGPSPARATTAAADGAAGLPVTSLAAPATPLLDLPGAASFPGQARAAQVTRRRRLVRTHDVSHEKPWGASVSAYVFTKSIAAGSFLVAALLPSFGLTTTGSDLQLAAAVIALVFVSVTGVLLVADLERPERFLRVLFRPQWRSWLAIGAWILTAYSTLLALWLALALFAGGFALGPLTMLGEALAVAAAVYTAFLFAQAEGRDFWQSPALAPGLLLHAVAAGAAVLLPLTAFASEWSAATPFLARLLALALAADLFVVLAGELYTPHASADAAAAARMVRQGPFARLFWSTVVGARAAAILLLLALPSAPAAVTAAALLACLSLVAWSHCFVEAGQAVPLS